LSAGTESAIIRLAGPGFSGTDRVIDRVSPGAGWGRAAATGAAPREAFRAQALVPAAIEPLTGTILDPPRGGASPFFVQLLAGDDRRVPRTSARDAAERYETAGRRLPRLGSIAV
jgi:hypothetical protein